MAVSHSSSTPEHNNSWPAQPAIELTHGLPLSGVALSIAAFSPVVGDLLGNRPLAALYFPADMPRPVGLKVRCQLERGAA